MMVRRASFWRKAGTAAALAVALAGCTPGGQFDPTSLFANDMFDTKKKLQGDREPVFPNGVPGTTSGVPQDLYKGYQPPPEQADVDANGAPAAAAAAEPEKPKPKPKPKPKVAAAPAQRPTRISVGPAGAAPAPQGAPAAAPQTNWPAPPQTAPAPQAGQPSQSPSQSPWPDPPKQ